MAEQASSFMRFWIAANVHDSSARRDRGLDEWVTDEIARLKDAARAADLDLGDPELDDDLLRDEITAAIKRIARS